MVDERKPRCYIHLRAFYSGSGRTTTNLLFFQPQSQNEINDDDENNSNNLKITLVAAIAVAAPEAEETALGTPTITGAIV